MEAVLKEEVHVEIVNSAMIEDVDAELVNELFEANDEGKVSASRPLANPP